MNFVTGTKCEQRVREILAVAEVMGAGCWAAAKEGDDKELSFLSPLTHLQDTFFLGAAFDRVSCGSWGNGRS